MKKCHQRTTKSFTKNGWGVSREPGAIQNAELDSHLGYDRRQPSDNANSRNGYTSKTLKTQDGQFKLNTPRDRDILKKAAAYFASNPE